MLLCRQTWTTVSDIIIACKIKPYIHSFFNQLWLHHRDWVSLKDYLQKQRSSEPFNTTWFQALLINHHQMQVINRTHSDTAAQSQGLHSPLAPQKVFTTSIQATRHQSSPVGTSTLQGRTWLLRSLHTTHTKCFRNTATHLFTENGGTDDFFRLVLLQDDHSYT